MGTNDNLPPGVSSNDPHIAGDDKPEIAPGMTEQLVLVHNNCGEVFHDATAQQLLEIAGMHGMECPQGTGDNDDWSIDFYDEVM